MTNEEPETRRSGAAVSRSERAFGRLERAFARWEPAVARWRELVPWLVELFAHSERAVSRPEGLFGRWKPLISRTDGLKGPGGGVKRSVRWPFGSSDRPFTRSERLIGCRKCHFLWKLSLSARFTASAGWGARLSGGLGSGSSGRRRWCPCRGCRVWRPASRFGGRRGPPHTRRNRPA